MNRTIKLLTVVSLCFAMILSLSPATTKALPPASWNPGDEVAVFDHSFNEEYWTNDSVNVQTADGTDVQFIASYVNYSESVGSFQAMLISLGIVEAANGTQSTLPYQLFGLHFTTPSGKDVFIGAILAFLYAWNDTNSNGWPNKDEDRWYLIPYGYNDGNGTAPTVQAVTATKLGTGHYQFGITYNNLYARVVDAKNPLGFWLSLIFPILEVTFSEFTVIYDVEVDPVTGEITAETFYRIGQVDELLLLGVSIPDPQDYLKGIGIGAAHFGVAFTSNYYVQQGTTTPTNATNWFLHNVTTDALGRERAFAVGVRGTYDQMNESTPTVTTIQSGLPAYNWVLQPNATDLVLVAWQLPFSADLFSVFGYAMSPYLQSLYTGPLDVYNHAAGAFGAAAFWYGVAFSECEGYRIEHDPVYTAYSNIGQATTPPAIPGFPFEAIFVGVITSLLAVFLVRRRRRH
ncbi:MAG: Loki-CTERM sorting domain-containing protein [Promethearchaeota archaeon]